MKFSEKDTALWFLDTPHKMRFDIPEPHTPMPLHAQIGFVHDIKDHFHTISDSFKNNIRYVTEPFWQAYAKGRHKLKGLFDKENFEETGTLILKGSKFTHTYFYYIKTTGIGDDWKYEFLFFDFSMGKGASCLMLDVFIACFPDSVKTYFWEDYYNNGQDVGWWATLMITFILFLKYCDIETKIVKPKSRVNHNGEKYINDCNRKIEILDSRWFTNIVRSEGFQVTGHFRWQPCGQGFKDRELIWISDFEKHGYTIKAKVGNTK